MAEAEVKAVPEADRHAFVAALREGFARAVRNAGTVERDILVGGVRIRMAFAGPGIVPAVMPALSHLEVPVAGEPDFRIRLFDAESTSAPLPFLLGSLVDLLRLRWWDRLSGRREIKGVDGEGIRAVFHLGPDILSVLDVAAGEGFYWVERADLIPYYEKGYPLSFLLNWCLAERRRFFVHAASIGRPSGGFLLTGKGGSGKSTTTLACLASSLGIVGDDYAVIDPDGPEACGLYNTVKLKGPKDVARFPHLARCVSNPDRVGEGEEGERAVIFLADHFPARLLHGFPVRAILVPRFVDRPETAIVPGRAAAALQALAPSTVFQLPGNAHGSFRALADLVRRVPTHTVELGRDIAAIPAALEAFLDSLERGE